MTFQSAVWVVGSFVSSVVMVRPMESNVIGTLPMVVGALPLFNMFNISVSYIRFSGESVINRIYNKTLTISTF